MNNPGFGHMGVNHMMGGVGHHHMGMGMGMGVPHTNGVPQMPPMHGMGYQGFSHMGAGAHTNGMNMGANYQMPNHSYQIGGGMMHTSNVAQQPWH